MEMIRAFLAVDIGESIRAELDALQRLLKKAHAEVRWVRPANLHLTLAFIGRLPMDQLDPIKAALNTALQHVPAFELCVKGTGFFGHPDRPRVLWAGVTETVPLRELCNATRSALQSAGIGFDDRKAFTPHLTLGRVTGSGGLSVLMHQLNRTKADRFGTVRIGSVGLFQSRLTPAGAEYAVLHRVMLPGG